MPVYDNDLPPGVTKDSFLVNPYGNKHDGNLFHDPSLNKTYDYSRQSGSSGGTTTSKGRSAPGISYGPAVPDGKPWPRWRTAMILVLLALSILVIARQKMVIERLPPYPQSEHVLLNGESLGSNPTIKSVAEKYKDRLALYKNQMAPLFPANAPWESFYSGCGTAVRCIAHPMDVFERFRKNSLAPDTFWNDLCNLTNYHRDDFPSGIPLQWNIKTKVQGAGTAYTTTFSQCELTTDSLKQVRSHITSNREQKLLVGNIIFGLISLTLLMGIWLWFYGRLPKWSQAGKVDGKSGGVGASYMNKLTSYPKLEKWSEGDRRIICGDHFFMAAAIQKFPQNYQYGSSEVRANVELAKSAIGKYYLNLRYAPDSIKSDPDLVILACERGGWQELKYASEKLLGEADFMLKVLEISNSYSVFDHATQGLLANEVFLCKALEINTGVFKYCTDGMKDDYDLVKSIVSHKESGREIQHASKRLLANKELVLLAYQNPDETIHIFDEISKALQRDTDVIKAAKKARDMHFS